MALTPEQKTARLTERINRNREEIKRLERQKAQTKRAECIQSSPNRQNDLSKIDTPLTRIG